MKETNCEFESERKRTKGERKNGIAFKQEIYKKNKETKKNGEKKPDPCGPFYIVTI